MSFTEFRIVVSIKNKHSLDILRVCILCRRKKILSAFSFFSPFSCNGWLALVSGFIAGLVMQG